MEVIKTTDPAEFERYANECLAGHEGMVIHTCDKPCIWTGQLRTYNPSATDLFVGKALYLGGTIVNGKGDVSICRTTWGNSDFAPDLVRRSAEWLKEKDLSVTTDENDVLVDGKKVISWARFTTVKGWCQSVVHYSVNVDLELIRAICTKPMVKVPGALSDYGITTKEILTLISG